VRYNDPSITHFPSKQTSEYLNKDHQIRTVVKLNDSIVVGAA